MMVIYLERIILEPCSISLQEQITQIKSDLLSVVNKEVQTLKETISKLTEENQELKQENEKLRNMVVNKKPST